jgi:putative hemolysin
MPTNPLARQISYASGIASRPGRAAVRLLENATGRLGLIRRARGLEAEVAQGRDLWEAACGRFGIGLELTRGSLEAIPATGPLVLVANHPYGILDGLALGRILSARRGSEFRILAHRVFRRAAELERVILPIDFDETPEAREVNLATRAEALRYLAAGGAIGIFPGGTVSTAPRPFGRPLDPVWRSFTARMILRSEATVIPVFFEGQNSRVFQIASHVHYSLRLGMLLAEFKRRVGTSVRLAVGEPIARERIEALRHDPRALMGMLRQATYNLSPDPVPPGALGHEFEAKHRRPEGAGRLLR